MTAVIDALETFLQVAATGSFSAVARARGVAVSSVTRVVDRLEADLGSRLLNRSSRRLTLTDAGEHLLPRARALVEDLRDLRDGLADLDAAPRGVLTVTAPTMFGRRHVGPAIHEFLRRHPQMQVELHLTDAMVDLAERRVDVAVRIGALPSSDLLATRFAPVRRLLCAAPSYLDRHGRPASPEALLQHNCLTLASTPLPAGWWSFAGVNRGRPLAISGCFRSDDTGALLEAAVAGLGVVHLASWLVCDDLAAGRLVALWPPDPVDRSTPAIHAVRLAGRSSAPKAKLFVAHLRDAFGPTPAWDL